MPAIDYEILNECPDCAVSRVGIRGEGARAILEWLTAQGKNPAETIDGYREIFDGFRFEVDSMGFNRPLFGGSSANDAEVDRFIADTGYGFGNQGYTQNRRPCSFCRESAREQAREDRRRRLEALHREREQSSPR